MSAADYIYDPNGTSPANLIQNEVHTASNTVGVFTSHGPFYQRSIVVEGSNDGNSYGLLVAGVDYVFSPLFKQQSAAVNSQICSWIVLTQNYAYIRLRYQALGQYEDTDLLNLLENTSFNRNDPLAWSELKIQATTSNNYSGVYEATDQIRAMAEGMQLISDAVQLLAQPTTAVTAQQLEDIKIQMDNFSSMIESNSEGGENLLSVLTDLSEQVDVMQDYFMQGGRGNEAYADGYTYESDGAIAGDHVPHMLNTKFVTADFWNLTPDGQWVPFKGNIRRVDNFGVHFDNDTAAKTIGAVRAPASNGYVEEKLDYGYSFDFEHNLGSRFCGVTVWRTTDDVRWDCTQEENIVELDSNRIRVTSDVRCRVAIVITPPTPNAYVFKSKEAADVFLPYHWLNTSYFIATVWASYNDEPYRVLPLYDGLSIPNNSRLKLELPQKENVKIILHPVGRVANNFDQTAAMQLIEQAERLAEAETTISNLQFTVDALASITPYVYQSEVAKLVHTVEHNRGTEFPLVCIWTKDDDGIWAVTEAKTRALSANVIEVTLVEPLITRVIVSQA